MSRQIPIHVEPGFKATVKPSRRILEPMSDDIRPPRLNRDRIEKDFEDASKRFFENKIGRHPELPDHTSWQRDFRSHSPLIFEDIPFRRSNPKIFSSSPSWRRNFFDETIQRMMREDSDSFDFSDPECEEDHHSPTDLRTSVKVAKTPSDPITEKIKHSSKTDRQSSSSGSSIGVDDDGFVDIPVIICKDGKTEENVREIEKEKPANGEGKEESVTKDQPNEVLESEGEKDNPEKGKNKCDSEFTDKTSSDTSEEKNDNDIEEKAKVNEKKEETDLETPKIESEKSAEENLDDNQLPQKSQQSVQLSAIEKIENELEKVLEKVKVFEPAGSTDNDKEYLWLEECLMRTLMALDAIEASGSKKIREARKAVVKRVQMGLNELEKNSIPSKKQE